MIDAGKMVASAVQGEPVAYISHTSEGDIPGWERQFDAPSHTPLYAAPQPAPDVSALDAHWAIKNPGKADQYRREAEAARVALGFSADSDEVSPCEITESISALVGALECALETMENVDGANDCSRGIDAVEEALATHRKGGDK